MTKISFAVLVLAIAASVTILAIWLYPSSQDFMSANPGWNGVQNFSHDYNVKDLNSPADLPDEPSDNLLIVIPDKPYHESDLEHIKQFVKAGGDLILMDDFGFGNEILSHFGLSVRFSGDVLLDPLFYEKNQYLPRIADFSPSLQSKGIRTITLNHATSLAGIEDRQVTASSSAYSYLDSDNDGIKNGQDPGGPFAVAAELSFGEGNVILLSDPSLLINSMGEMEGNREFIAYLFSGKSSGTILIDAAHLEPSTLDASKSILTRIKETVGNPYLLPVLIGVIFALIIRYTLVKGDTGGKHSKSLRAE